MSNHCNRKCYPSTGGRLAELRADLERCDREIAEIQAMPVVVAGKAPAWLVTLGINDWQYERRLIEAELG